MTWPIQVDQSSSFERLRSEPHLADDYATKADNHPFAGDLTAHHEAPALIEHLDELA
jgi:hypothetical protein